MAPFGLKGWHVAFMVVGLPGLVMAAWVRTLREPRRGISEGLVAEAHPAPFKVLGSELMSVIPPLNLVGFLAHKRTLAVNLAAAVAFAVASWLLVVWTGSVAQWIATGIGVYVTFSWAQSLKIRDPATYVMMFHSKSFIYTMLAFPTISFVAYGVGFWISPLLMRVHEVSPAQVGLYIGLGSALGGLIGVTLGGVLADFLKQRMATGRLFLGYIAVAGTIPLVLAMVYTESLWLAFVLNFLVTIPSSCWVGVPPSTASDLVMPRMRAVASAYYILVNTFIGLALGPYVMGQLSDMYFDSGMNEADSLRTAIAVSLLILAATLVFLVLAQRHLARDEATRLERAATLGEPV